MDPFEILTLFPHELKQLKISKPISKANGGGLTPYQMKILVAMLVVILGCMLVVFVKVAAGEYKKASKRRDETNTPISSHHDLNEVLDPLLDSTEFVGYESSPPLGSQDSHSETDPNIPMCQRCDCEKCKKLQQRAKRKRGKHASLETVACLFPRSDLMNILDEYWEVLKFNGLFADQSSEHFLWSNAINSPVHIQRRQYHLILRKMEAEDNLQQWRRFVAEYRTLKGYQEFHRQATRQRINGTQTRGSGENDNNKAHKEYIKHMFPDSYPETLLIAPAALKKDLQFARRWAIWVEGYADKKDGLVPGLGVRGWSACWTGDQEKNVLDRRIRPYIPQVTAQVYSQRAFEYCQHVPNIGTNCSEPGQEPSA